MMKRRINLLLILIFLSAVHFATAQPGSMAELKNKLSDEVSFSNAELILKIAGDYEKENTDSALVYYLRGIKLSETLSNDSLLAKSYSGAGYTYYITGNYASATANFFSALKLFERVKNDKERIRCLQFISLAYTEQGMLDKAMNYSREALSIALTKKDEYQTSISLTCIGSIFYTQLNYDSALVYFQKALEKMEAINDKQGISDALNNVALLYTEKKEFDKALNIHLRSLQLARELKDKRGVAASFHNIALVYQEMKNYSTSVIYLDSCIAIAREVDEKSYLKESYSSLSELYAEMGNYELAYKTHLLFSQISDTLLNDESKKQFAEMSTKYESEKKDNEIKIQAQKASQQRLIRNIVIGGFLIVVILLFFVYRSYQRQRHINEKLQQAQNQLIESEKMAAFGMMATRVSHQIMNPLNFVNNFSDLSHDLVDDVMRSGTDAEKSVTGNKLKENLQKINEHGRRAASIVKELQEHSKKGTSHEFFEEERRG